MKFIKQPEDIQLIDIDKQIGGDLQNTRWRHGELLPNEIRCIICGPSGLGKTNALIIGPQGFNQSIANTVNRDSIGTGWQHLEQPKREFCISNSAEATHSSVLEPLLECMNDVSCQHEGALKKIHGFCSKVTPVDGSRIVKPAFIQPQETVIFQNIELDRNVNTVLSQRREYYKLPVPAKLTPAANLQMMDYALDYAYLRRVMSFLTMAVRSRYTRAWRIAYRACSNARFLGF